MAARRLRQLRPRLAIAQLAASDPVPAWAKGSPLSVTRTTDELTIVCPEHHVPDNVKAERGWTAFAVEGPLDFAETGVIAGLSVPLAEAGIPVFVISTFDTDYLLVRSLDAGETIVVLRRAGFLFD